MTDQFFGVSGIDFKNIIKVLMEITGRVYFKHGSWRGAVATAVLEKQKGGGAGIWLENLHWKPSKPYFDSAEQPELLLIDLLCCPRANSIYFNGAGEQVFVERDGLGTKHPLFPIKWSVGPSRPPFATLNNLTPDGSPTDFFDPKKGGHGLLDLIHIEHAAPPTWVQSGAAAAVAGADGNTETTISARFKAVNYTYEYRFTLTDAGSVTYGMFLAGRTTPAGPRNAHWHDIFWCVGLGDDMVAAPRALVAVNDAESGAIVFNYPADNGKNNAVSLSSTLGSGDHNHGDGDSHTIALGFGPGAAGMAPLRSQAQPFDSANYLFFSAANRQPFLWMEMPHPDVMGSLFSSNIAELQPSSVYLVGAATEESPDGSHVGLSLDMGQNLENNLDEFGAFPTFGFGSSWPSKVYGFWTKMSHLHFPQSEEETNMPREYVGSSIRIRGAKKQVQQ